MLPNYVKKKNVFTSEIYVFPSFSAIELNSGLVTTYITEEKPINIFRLNNKRIATLFLSV
jgi:hypothetical protein